MHRICAVTHRKRPKRDHSGNCRKANAVSESAHISSSYTFKPAKIQLLVKAVRLSATDHDVSGADQLLDGVNVALHVRDDVGESRVHASSLCVPKTSPQSALRSGPSLAQSGGSDSPDVSVTTPSIGPQTLMREPWVRSPVEAG